LAANSTGDTTRARLSCVAHGSADPSGEAVGGPARQPPDARRWQSDLHHV